MDSGQEVASTTKLFSKLLMPKVTEHEMLHYRVFLKQRKHCSVSFDVVKGMYIINKITLTLVAT